MPSILPEYEYDIFISYRQNDNRRDGWVTNFVAALKDELEATLKNPVSIYFDENPHDGLLETDQVGATLEKKLKCIVFIPIISQTYCDTSSFAWQHEFLPFIKLAREDELGMNITQSNGNMASRVLPVQIHDLDVQDQALLAKELGGPLRSIDFIYKEAGVNRPLKPNDDRSLNLAQTDYHNQINKVANALKEIILATQEPAGASENRPSTNSNQQSIKRNSHPVVLRWLAIFILPFLVGVYFLFIRDSNTDQVNIANPSVAVIPLSNLSDDPNQEYFSVGITDQIITSLSRLKGLKVIARTSVMQYKGTKKTIREIANDLDVNYVLAGSIQKSGDKIRVSVQLILGKDNTPVWTEVYNRQLVDIFDVQDDISEHIANALLDNIIKKQGIKIDVLQTRNLKAFEQYMMGKLQDDRLYGFGLKNELDSSIDRTIKYYRKALEIDPKFGDAYASLGDAYGVAYFWGRKPKGLDPAVETIKYAKKALALNQDNPVALAALAYIKRNADWDWQGAKVLYEKAIQIDPNNSLVLDRYALLLSAINQVDLAEKFAKKAHELSPFSKEHQRTYFRTLMFNRKFEDAIKFANHWMPDLSVIEGAEIYQINKSLAYKAIFDNLINIDTSAIDMEVVRHLFLEKDTKPVSEYLYKNLPRYKQIYHSKFDIRDLIFIEGAPLDTVFNRLKYSEENREGTLVYLLIDPRFDRIREDPRYDKLLEKMGLDKYQ